MKNKKYLVLIIVLLCLPVVFAMTGTIRINAWTATGASMPSGYTGYEYTSNSFTSNATFQLTDIEVYMKKTGLPTGKLSAILYRNDANDKPTGSILRTSNAYVTSGLNTSYAWVRMSFNSSYYQINSSTEYNLVFYFDGDNSNYMAYETSPSVTNDVKYGSSIAGLTDYYNGRAGNVRYYGTDVGGSDSCTYSGTGDWLITNNCNVTTTIHIESGHNVIVKNSKKLRIQTGGSII
jgi:hypothetical protein